MKILHIHPSMKGGGIEAMICNLSNQMSQTENVHVCSIFKPTEEDVFWNKLNPSVKKSTLGKIKKGFSLCEIFKIFRFLYNGKFDAVNLHGFFYYYAFAVFFLHNRINFFYTIHSEAMMENCSWDKTIFIFKKFCFKKGWVKPITISEFSKKSFTDLYCCDSKLIYNGVPRIEFPNTNVIEKYKITSNTKVFIHAGRIDVSKNQLVLCKVFKRLIECKNDIVLLIAGSKQKEDIFNSLEPYWSDRIIYLGERDDICQLMAHSDAMCLPSIWEGMPVTILEALSLGCIPICSPVGGIPNVIESGHNGLLSKSCSEDDYLEIVEKYLQFSEDEIRIMKQNCIESFSKYDIVNVANSYLQYYQSRF